MLANMHRGCRHEGKVPKEAIARIAMKTRLNELENELATAVEEEGYEEAARLRDEISNLRADMASAEGADDAK